MVYDKISCQLKVDSLGNYAKKVRGVSDTHFFTAPTNTVNCQLYIVNCIWYY